MKKRYVLGKVDYNGTGRKINEATITWELKDGRFSMQAEIWNGKRTDCLTCGQCVDTVAAFFPEDKKAQRMAAIWERWHLNNMRAVSPAQEAWLRENPFPNDGRYYLTACAKLAEAGLNPDPNYIHEGKPYSYGHAWLKEELPAEVIAEIESW